MAKSFTVTANNNVEQYNAVQFEGGADTYSFDLTPWQEDNNTVTGVTWTLDSGQAAISGEDLTSGIASALITTAKDGTSVIKVTVATSTETKVLWLYVRAKTHRIPFTDYV